MNYVDGEVDETVKPFFFDKSIVKGGRKRDGSLSYSIKSLPIEIKRIIFARNVFFFVFTMTRTMPKNNNDGDGGDVIIIIIVIILS